MTGQILSSEAQRRSPSGLAGHSGAPTQPTRARWLVLAASALLMTGCSLSFIYPKLDTLVGWQLDNYLDLESGQERWLDERLEERLGWHQREQLPQWREALASLRAEIANGQLDADRHRYHGDRARDLIRASMTGLIDDSAHLASTLTDAQVTHLIENFDEETEELKEELAERAAEPEQTERKRLEELEDDVEQWLGSISNAQREYLKQWSDGSIRWSDYAVESRQRWREFIVQALAQRADTTAAHSAVEQMFLRPESLRTTAYQDAVARQSEHRRTLHLYLLQSMTEKQKKHLLAELDDLLEEVDELLAE